jgi:cell division protease FtsH
LPPEPQARHEIRRLVEGGYQEAQRILTDRRADLEVLAKGLLEFETLTSDRSRTCSPANGQPAIR